MSDELFIDASWLVAAIMRGLMAFPEDAPGVDTILSRIAEQDLSVGNFKPPQPQRLPGCRHLPEAVAAGLIVSADLCSAIASTEDCLYWTQNDHYTDELLGQPGFKENSAFAEIIGTQGFFAGADFRMGLMLIGPGLTYKDHYHAAPELYWLLTGPIEFRRAPNAYQQFGTASTIWNAPNEVHAMKTGERPLLAVWAWASDVDQLPVIVADRDQPVGSEP